MPSRDTHPDAERVQIELLRAAPSSRRFELLCGMVQAAWESSRRALRRANPEMSEQEIGLLFVELHYGRDLAERVRVYLWERQN